MLFWKNIRGAIKKEYQSDFLSLITAWNNHDEKINDNASNDVELMKAQRKLRELIKKGWNISYQQKRGYYTLTTEV